MSQADFSRLFEAPLQEQLEPLKENSDSSRREALDAVEPDALYRKLAEGARSAKAGYSSRLTQETYGLIDACLAKAKQDCEQVRESWAQLDHYDRHGVWEGMKAGYGAGEASIGATVGSFLFGEIGAVIGGAFGGWVAGNRVDENFQKGMQAYGNWVIHWCEEIDNELQNRILPSVQRDLERPLAPASESRQLLEKSHNHGTSFGRISIGLLLLAGILVGGWYFYQHHEEEQKKAAAARQTAELNSSFTALEGKWISDNNRGYDVVLVGDALEFRVHSALDSQRDGYQGGEMHFRLRRADASHNRFIVEQKIRPILPVSLKYGKGSQDSCQELITTINSQVLNAQLVDDRLSIDIARLWGTPEILDTKRGEVLNCKNLQLGKLSRIQIALTRLAAGREFPDLDKVAQIRKTVAKRESPRNISRPHPSPEAEHETVTPKPETDASEKSERTLGVGSAE